MRNYHTLVILCFLNNFLNSQKCSNKDEVLSHKTIVHINDLLDVDFFENQCFYLKNLYNDKYVNFNTNTKNDDIISWTNTKGSKMCISKFKVKVDNKVLAMGEHGFVTISDEKDNATNQEFIGLTDHRVFTFFNKSNYKFIGLDKNDKLAGSKYTGTSNQLFILEKDNTANTVMSR